MFQSRCRPFDAKPTGAETLGLDISIPNGRYVIINWGDGNTTKIIGPQIEQIYTNAYSGAGTFHISISGDFRALTRLKINTVSIDGDLATMCGALQGLTYFRCSGSNTISGDVADLPSGLTYFYCTGSNTVSDYTGKEWTVKPGTFVLIPVGAGGLSEAEVDQLLIDFDADLVWAGSDVITLTGTNAPRSVASNAAVTSMEGEGATITTST